MIRAEQFEALVDRSGDCWHWRGSRRNGYGVYGGRYAHRVAWVIAVGPIPAAAQVLHRCDTPSCVRPSHLYLGTPADNQADKARKGRAARHFGNGWHHGRLTDEQVAKMRALHADGVSQKRLAKMFGIAQSTANQIMTGRRRPATR